jgi:hypothetical protein
MNERAPPEATPDVLPLTPGQSQFRIKGVAYRGIVEFMKAQGGSFLEDVVGGLSPEMQAFCRQPFMAASWYDALPIRGFTGAVARRLGVSHVVYLRGGAAKQARLDARTAYKHLMTGIPPFEVVQRQVNIGLRYYSFLEGESVPTGPTQAEIRVRGMPHYLAPWFMPMQESYTTEALIVSGATHALVRAELSPRSPLEQAPLDPTHIVFKVSWVS